MKNKEKYRDLSDSVAAFNQYCKAYHPCKNCPIGKHVAKPTETTDCYNFWLEQEETQGEEAKIVDLACKLHDRCSSYAASVIIDLYNRLTRAEAARAAQQNESEVTK